MRVAAEIRVPEKGTVTVRAFKHEGFDHEYFVVESTRANFTDETAARKEQQLEEAMRVAAREAVHLSIFGGWTFPS